MADPMIILDPEDRRLIEINAAALRMLGTRDKREVLGRHPAELSPEHQPDGQRSHEKAATVVAAALHSGSCRFEWCHRDIQGRPFHVEVLLTRFTNNGRMLLVGHWHDISTKVQAERNADLRLAALEAAANAIVITDHDGKVVWANAAFTRLTGYGIEDVIGQTPRVLKSGHQEGRFYEQMWATITAGAVWQGELTNRRKDGSLYEEEMTITPMKDGSGRISHFIAVKQDVTERKKLQDEYLRTQRTASLGTLAGGIAHDLNNILQPILLSVDMLKNGEARPDRLAMLDTVGDCARRASDMVRQVLSFARGVEGKKIEVQTRHLIREMERIMRETFPKNIAIDVQIPRGLHPVHGDPTQIQQVLMNLCINARDAMEQGGVLMLTARNTTLDEAAAALIPDARPGEYVLFEVTDNGEGMHPDILERIFDPFFTTKEIGRGTGLGLSTTQTIVRGHRGFIRVASERGHGSRFQVYLPALSVSPARPAREGRKQVPKGSGELVLVVDDEAAVREAVGRILESNGYRYLMAHDGAEAVALYATHRFEVSVVLADLMMPVMDGKNMIRILRRMNPGVRVICASGCDRSGTFNLEDEGIAHFLPKPYGAPELLVKLRSILDSPAPVVAQVEA